jgi:hydrogenase-1 operon protein HyaF
MSESKLIPLTDLATPAQPSPSNPLRWADEPVAEGVFLGVADSNSALELLGTPAMALPETPRLPEDFAPSSALRSWLRDLLLALDAAAAGQESQRLHLDDALNADDRIAVAQILGEGEVDGSVHLDGVAYELREATLNGVWQVTGDDGSEHVEVGRIPQVIADAAKSLRPAPLRVPEPEAGVMNATAILSEISDRAERCATGDSAVEPNHVINFTLLPTTEADQATLLEVLGRADLRLRSGGFGDCHILATQVRHVWAVQYVNAMDHTILDTIEIGDIPAAALAAREDFEDSAARLRDITEAYLR